MVKKMAAEAAGEDLRHRCALCDKVYSTASGLTRHLNGTNHAKKVAKAAGLTVKHHCEVCDKPYANQGRMNRHLNSVEHRNNVAKAKMMTRPMRSTSSSPVTMQTSKTLTQTSLQSYISS
jgi:uncharacterized C2H2 Zn-finger protein